MRKCTICFHRKKDEIDHQLVEGVPVRTIAAYYDLHKSSVSRHRMSHLPKSLVAARKAKEMTSADALLENVCKLQMRAERILTKAEAANDHRTSLAAIRECRSTVELLARLVGELKESSTTVNLLIQPEYQQMRARVINALEPHPEARISVANALKAFTNASD